MILYVRSHAFFVFQYGTRTRSIRRSTPRKASRCVCVCVCVCGQSKNKQTVIGIFKVKEVKNLDSGGSYNIQDLDHELFWARNLVPDTAGVDDSKGQNYDSSAPAPLGHFHFSLFLFHYVLCSLANWKHWGERKRKKTWQFVWLPTFLPSSLICGNQICRVLVRSYYLFFLSSLFVCRAVPPSIDTTLEESLSELCLSEWWCSLMLLIFITLLSDSSSSSEDITFPCSS